MSVRLVLVKAKVFWGYSIKYPSQSAAQDSSPLPPPTTVLGALATPYAKYVKLPETSRIGAKTYSTAVKLLVNGVVKYCTSGITDPLAAKYSDIARNIMLIYQRHKEREYHFAAQAMGKVYAPLPRDGLRSKLLLAYVVSDKYVELITKLAWGITSVGSKEGLVSVDEVTAHDLKIVESRGVVETPFITPTSIAECNAGCTEVELCSLNAESYSAGEVCKTDRFLIPTYPAVKNLFGGYMKVNVGSNAAVAVLPLDYGVTYIVMPKEAIS